MKNSDRQLMTIVELLLSFPTCHTRAINQILILVYRLWDFQHLRSSRENIWAMISRNLVNLLVQQWQLVDETNRRLGNARGKRAEVPFVWNITTSTTRSSLGKFSPSYYSNLCVYEAIASYWGSTWFNHVARRMQTKIHIHRSTELEANQDRRVMKENRVALIQVPDARATRCILLENLYDPSLSSITQGASSWYTK